jgi:hypothetical protein
VRLGRSASYGSPLGAGLALVALAARDRAAAGLAGAGDARERKPGKEYVVDEREGNDDNQTQA